MAAADSILPTFFVIGAPKCGTTSLHHYLDQHPQISMSAVKEPYILARGDYRSRLSEYSEMLDPTAPVRGESSAVYSMFPHFPGVPERIAEVVPDALLLYVVGDPVDRAVAHYAQRLADGTETASLDIALGDESDENVYVTAGCYAMQLSRYLDRFPADRILVLDQDDLRERTAVTLGEAFAFLGVDPAFRSTAFREQLNRREEHRAPTRLGRALRGRGAFERARRIPLPRIVRERLRRVSSRQVGRPSLPPELRARLEERLREEAMLLRELTGRPFSGWSV